MSIDRLVVIGGSLAGLRAVEAARKAGFDGSITLIGAERHLPYDRPPLSKDFLNATEPGGQASAPFFRSDDVFADELRVELLLGAPATSLDVGRRIVYIGDREVGYDALVIATGSKLRTLPDTDHLDGVHGLRTLDDSLAIRAALDAGARTVVIGAGFIGSEVAASAQKRGVPVTVVEALPTPLVRATGTVMGAAVASLHERNGTRLLCGTGVKALEGDGRVQRVVLSDGTVLEADLVIVGIGVVPCTDWLEGSGLTVDNGLVCDETLWTGVPGVYAAGDVANWLNPMFGVHQRMENWTAAAEQGAAAARNAIDPDNAKPYETVPYFWSDWYDARIQFVGVPECDEVLVVDGDVDCGDRWTALYRHGDRLVGALTLNGQTVIMKYRRMIAQKASWDEALEFADKRKAAAAAKVAALP
ncbi:NAD(P)/FAD-dependent oxidoreductase [Mycolicibacterium komossense]|jgi:NADPH-dependent 2,4-dienoyl-CoA reductase/sulfur reductase-like enzyme|uniref:FAD-dependent oxidoreductase n=1 Tax=Mycolicibacterium komossense TaxID=1779 RepID=A0ABT3CAG3_9MYCO|nr:FAD-dependent oxidoreductase [Mycolicibacterium komossense]MCV7226442.1 FAD-dependent oxidoreductase [Mycolicibacterium komossense]